MDLLKLDGTLVNVGALQSVSGLDGRENAFGRKSFVGSVVGGVAETQQVIDYCAARNISAEVEIIKPDQIQEVYRWVLGKVVRYSVVINVSAAWQAASHRRGGPICLTPRPKKEVGAGNGSKLDWISSSVPMRRNE
ncbi:MAG TPA: hypothetical protein VHB49_19205 [Bradyrhizobium sp.]|nr:hypothetical protein [Bradyrhizobium sp.]